MMGSRATKYPSSVRRGLVSNAAYAACQTLEKLANHLTSVLKVNPKELPLVVPGLVVLYWILGTKSVFPEVKSSLVQTQEIRARLMHRSHV